MKNHQGLPKTVYTLSGGKPSRAHSHSVYFWQLMLTLVIDTAATPAPLQLLQQGLGLAQGRCLCCCCGSAAQQPVCCPQQNNARTSESNGISSQRERKKLVPY